MNKSDFFLQLQDKLRSLPEEERKHIIQVYEDLFQKAAENGKSEADIIRSMGFTHYTAIPTPGPPPSQGMENGLRSILASLALGFFNLILLGPFIGIAAILFAVGVVAMTLVTFPLWVALGSGIPSSFPMLWFEIFTALTGMSVGVLLWMGVAFLIKWCWRGFKRYVKLNIRLIKGD